MKLSETLQWILIVGLITSNIYTLSLTHSNNEDVIYTKGIVITDGNGNERILIGAPIPNSKDRIRDDLKRVEEIYSKDFPPETNFMELYKNNIRHNTNGILILDEKGFDKVTIGDPVSDPYYGTKIGLQSGIVVCDSLGAERTGYGLINIDGRYRAVLGLDRDDGIEGISMGVDDSLGIKMTLRSKDLNEVIEIGENKGPDKSFGFTYTNRKDSLTIKNKFNKN